MIRGEPGALPRRLCGRDAKPLTERPKEDGCGIPRRETFDLHRRTRFCDFRRRFDIGLFRDRRLRRQPPPPDVPPCTERGGDGGDEGKRREPLAPNLMDTTRPLEEFKDSPAANSARMVCSPPVRTRVLAYVPLLSVSVLMSISPSTRRRTGALRTGRPSSVVRFPVQATAVRFTSTTARLIFVSEARTSNVVTSEKMVAAVA